MFIVQVSKQVIVESNSRFQGERKTAQKNLARINTCNKNNSIEI